MLIYKATNLLNGECYIGYTTKTLNERKKQHEGKSCYNSQYHFHNKIIRNK